MDLHFYGAFPVFWPLKALYSTCHNRPFKHTFIYTEGRGCHDRCQLLIRSNLGFRTFSQGHFGMQLGEPQIQTSDHPINRLVALPPRVGTAAPETGSGNCSPPTTNKNQYTQIKHYKITATIHSNLSYNKISYFELSLLVTYFTFKSILIAL